MTAVTFELHDDIAKLTLNKPEKGNALCLAMVEDLIAALETARQARLIVFHGQGRHFCTGLDLSNLAEESDATLLNRFVRIEELRAAIETSSVPTVAFGFGATYGAGADIFAACDHRIAAPGTRFAFPGGAFGIVLGTARLTTIMGQQRARDTLLAQRILEVEKALEAGLVTEVLHPSETASRLSQLALEARKLPRGAAAALREMSRCDGRDRDLAALVRSASRPGLKKRIEAYRATLK
ncbi:enoyl-CoA hydratase/isomerase family protein [Pelagibacterium nitratireducens]|uniref:Enoyl-CoA hydratase/isomerase family protein n=1 Tax=Pelagibacterium nitratireducens TaxID=1046114 RepID=A0ABZ2I1W7_9HYPH